MQIATFALTMAAGQLTPGPDMLLILKNTPNHGLSTGLATITGICLGIVVHVTLVFTGLAAILANAPTLYRSVQILGACYLLWVAWKLLSQLPKNRPSRSNEESKSCSDSTIQSPLSDAPTQRELPFWAAFREGLLTNLSNVKVVILFSSILAPLAMTANGLEWIYGAVIIIEAAIIWPIFAWLMQRPLVRHAFFRYQLTCNLAFALLIGSFAVRLLLGW